MPSSYDAIKWDETGKRLYEVGVDHGVLYVKKGGETFTGVAWDGLISVAESPDGAEVQDFWADNIKYASMRSAENTKGTIEAYMYPPEFGECDGSAELATGVSIGQQGRKPFGFCYRTKIGNDADGADAGYKIHIVYNCTASPSEKNYQTVNDSPDAITFSWEYDATPVPVTDHKPTATLIIDSTKIDPTALSNIEKGLYGSTSAPATLLMPDDIKKIIDTAAASAKV